MEIDCNLRKCPDLNGVLPGCTDLIDFTLLERCNSYLERLRSQIEQSKLRVLDLRIDGSVRSGLVADPSDSDLDIIISLPAEIPISPETANLVAETVGGEFVKLLAPCRFGKTVLLAHLTAQSQLEGLPFRNLDLWLVHQPFVTMSPFWQDLFSPDELGWQRLVRNFVRRHLSADDYGVIKALQLAEARWRFCACFAIPQIALSPARAGSIIDALPLKGVPPEGTADFIKRWAQRDRSDSWLNRPLQTLPYNIRLALEELREGLGDPPQAPPWTDFALQVQENSQFSA